MNKKNIFISSIFILAIIGALTFISLHDSLHGFKDQKTADFFTYVMGSGDPMGGFFTSTIVLILIFVIAIIIAEITFIAARRDSFHKWNFLTSLEVKGLSILGGLCSSFTIVWYSYFSSAIPGYFIGFFSWVGQSLLPIGIIIIIILWIYGNHILQKKIRPSKKRGKK